MALSFRRGDIHMKYDISLIDTLIFDESNNDKYNSTYELTREQISVMPKSNDDISELKNKLTDIFVDKFKESYAMVEALCDISEESFRKFIRFSSKRVIPFVPLAKFCIGASLTPDDAIELFALSGHPLNRKRKFDYILLCELENKDDLTGFDKTLIEFGFNSVLSDESKLNTDELFENNK